MNKADASKSANDLQHQGRAVLKRLQRQSKERILVQLKAMDPILFEYVVAAIFEKRGYQASVTIASGDEGVDVVVRKGMTKAVVQCKRYHDSIGQPVVRDLYGTMLHNRAKESYLVTTAMITRQAQNWSRGKPIHLIDGFKLTEWIVSSGRTRLGQRFLTFAVALIVMIGLVNAFLYLPFTWFEAGFIERLFTPSNETMPVDSPISIIQPPTKPPSIAPTATSHRETITLPIKPVPPIQIPAEKFPYRIHLPMVMK